MKTGCRQGYNTDESKNSYEHEVLLFHINKKGSKNFVKINIIYLLYCIIIIGTFLYGNAERVEN